VQLCAGWHAATQAPALQTLPAPHNVPSAAALHGAAGEELDEPPHPTPARRMAMDKIPAGTRIC
jgi:hypothetical protein